MIFQSSCGKQTRAVLRPLCVWAANKYLMEFNLRARRAPTDEYTCAHSPCAQRYIFRWNTSATLFKTGDEWTTIFHKGAKRAQSKDNSTTAKPMNILLLYSLVWFWFASPLGAVHAVISLVLLKYLLRRLPWLKLFALHKFSKIQMLEIFPAFVFCWKF